MKVRREFETLRDLVDCKYRVFPAFPSLFRCMQAFACVRVRVGAASCQSAPEQSPRPLLLISSPPDLNPPSRPHTYYQFNPLFCHPLVLKHAGPQLVCSASCFLRASSPPGPLPSLSSLWTSPCCLTISLSQKQQTNTKFGKHIVPTSFI